MPEQIKSIEAIEAEARAAAVKYDNVNDACPYSFYSEAGRVYRNAFVKAKLKQYITPDKGATAAVRRPEVASAAARIAARRPDFTPDKCAALAKAQVLRVREEGGAA